ncbi:MAG: cation:proton antiporter [Chloroflexota bacterium]|nr:cation:proton antiporter [Chloroflexota bacterium]
MRWLVRGGLGSLDYTIWYLIVGAIFILMALSGTVLQRLPLSSSMLYLAAGFLIGSSGLALLDFDPIDQAAIVERITEVAVIVSLFTSGLKLRVPLRDLSWRLPVVLAFGSMALTVGLIALIGVLALGLPLGAAILLGAILAPTDPVLASDVQVSGPRDRDRLRFTLTGEASLNDGTAFPFVMLGLGLLGLHEIGESGWRWLAVDVLWAIPGGLLIGGVLGTVAGNLILYLRRVHQESVGLDDFLALGLIALSYGVALLLHTYGFLAVFAAGLALRKIEERSSGSEQEPEDVMDAIPAEETAAVTATHPDTAAVYMTQSVLGFTEQLERIGEVAVMLMVGAMISTVAIPFAALWFVPLLLLGVRPVAAGIGTIGSAVTREQRAFIGWFGIRGIGSIYYLMFAIEQNLPDDTARLLTGITLAVVATSVIVHGISVTPLMRRYTEDGEDGEEQE